jgi:hypothetical protein
LKANVDTPNFTPATPGGPNTILNAVGTDNANGWPKMTLQIVLETSILGTTPSSPRIVDLYFWK